MREYNDMEIEPEVKKDNKAMLSGIITGAVLFGTGFLGGSALDPLNQKPAINPDIPVVLEDEADFAAFWKTWRELEDKFVSASTTAVIPDQEKIWGAIGGLVDSYGDPYTVFMPPQELEEFQASISGEFYGVGIELGIRDDMLTVISPLQNTPAYRAGVKAGDKIVKIEDEISTSFTINEAVKRIRGEKGDPVRLTLLRGNKEPFEVTIVRDAISIPTHATEIRDARIVVEENGKAVEKLGRVFVLRLFSFNAKSINAFREGLREFIDSGTNKLVLDLRGNPGGYLEAAVDMASFFLPVGTPIVSEDFGKNGDPRVHRSYGYDIFTDNLEMVILVDGGSASASEILAGALGEHGIATIVGDQTFGKGSVQQVLNITSETSLKVTIARWLTPHGLSISNEGVTPDILVQYEDRGEGEDNQLDAAIEYLLK